MNTKIMSVVGRMRLGLAIAGFLASGALSAQGGLVGHWKLDEGSGTIANDVSGNQNNGMLINGPAWTTGKRGCALQFDGVNDHVNMGNPPVFNIAKALTIEAWVNSENAGGNQPVVVKDGPNGGCYWFGVYQGGFGLLLSDNGNGWKSLGLTKGSIANNTWYHLAVTWDGSTWRCYQDGKEVLSGSYNGTLSPSASPLHIGQNSSSGTTHFKGRIDEVKVFDRALSQQEIAEQYSGPVAYWTFDEGSGTIANDLSANQNNGMLINGPAWTTGKREGALQFDGVNDHVNMGNPPAFNVAKALTIEAWVNSGNAGGNQPVVVKDGPNGGCYWFGVYQGGFGLLLSDNGNGWKSLGLTKGNIANNTWYHLAVTWDGSTWRCYQDGKEVLSGLYNGVLSPSSSPLHIGQNSLSGTTHFKGRIDEVKVFDRALTAVEVAQEYVQVGGSFSYTATVEGTATEKWTETVTWKSSGFKTGVGTTKSSLWVSAGDYYTFTVKAQNYNMSVAATIYRINADASRSYVASLSCDTGAYQGSAQTSGNVSLDWREKYEVEMTLGTYSASYTPWGEWEVVCYDDQDRLSTVQGAPYVMQDTISATTSPMNMGWFDVPFIAPHGGTLSGYSYTVRSSNPAVGVKFSDTGTSSTASDSADVISWIK
ncbi:MAG: LamG domain-containing protein [bacterium]